MSQQFSPHTIRFFLRGTAGRTEPEGDAASGVLTTNLRAVLATRRCALYTRSLVWACVLGCVVVAALAELSRFGARFLRFSLAISDGTN